MPPAEAFIWIGVASAALVTAGALLASLLRRACLPGGAPAAGVVGGLLAGVLLGVTVLGRVAPGVAEAVYLGAGAERAALVERQREHAAELLAMREMGVTPVAIEEQADRHARLIEPERDALDMAERRHRSAWAVALGAVGGAWLIASGLGVGCRRRQPVPFVRPSVAGVIAAFLAGGLAFLMLRWSTGSGVPEAYAYACALAISGVGGVWSGRSAALRAGGARAAGSASAVMLIATAVGLASLAPGWATGVTLGGAVIAGGVWSLPVVPHTVRRIGRAVSLGVLAPGVVAVAASHADLIAVAGEGRFWIALVIAALLAGDARWLGGWAGWSWAGGEPGRRSAWSRSAAMLAGGAGAAQAMLAGVAFLTGVIPAAALAALVLAAATIDPPARLRARLSAALDAIAPNRTNLGR